MATYQLISPPSTEPLTLAEAKAHLNMLADETFADDLISSLIIAARQSVENYTWRTLMNQQWKLILDKGEVQTTICFTKCPAVSVDSVKYIDSTGTQQTLSADAYQVDTISEPARIKIITMPVIKDVMNAFEISFTSGYNQTSGSPVLADSVNITTNTISKATHNMSNGSIIKFTGIGSVTGISTSLQYYLVNTLDGSFKVSLMPGGAAVDLGGANTTPPTYQLIISVVPEAIKAAMKLMLAHLYEHREDVVIGTIVQPLDQGSKALLQPYRLDWYYQSN